MRASSPEVNAARRLSERKYQRQHRPQINAYQKQIKTRVGERFRLGRWNAKRRGYVWELTLEEFACLADQPCSYCDRVTVHGGCGLDRLDSTKGYILDNVAPSCRECNRIKSYKYTPEETRVMIHALLSYHDGQRTRPA